MAPNPILIREWRSRWRDWRSFAMVTACAIALSLFGLALFASLAALLNAELVSPGQGWGEFSSASSALAGMGGAMFRVMMPTQALIWLFLGALLTAGSIARERERGLLESLQLSRTSARSQIGGRWVSALAFLSYIGLVTLPGWGLALFLGGLSPLDLLVGALLVLASAGVGAMLGLWMSARSHRPLNAVMGALLLLAVWTGASVYAFAADAWVAAPDWVYVLACLHPWALGALLGGPGEIFLSAPSAIQQAFVTFDFGAVAGPIFGIWAAFCLVGWWMSARTANRPLAPPIWARRNRHVEAWKTRLDTPSSHASARSRRELTREKTARVLVSDLPLERLAAFRNPVLARELRGRFRLRSVGPLLSFARWMIGIGAAVVWIYALVAVFDGPSRAGLVGTGTLLICGIAAFMALALAALSFVRERDGGTWEGLRLSSLRAREIVVAKWAAPLLWAFYVALPFLVLFVLALNWGGDGLWSSGVEIDDFALMMAAMVAFLSWVTALGLWVSWRARTPVAAVTWSFVLVFVFFLVLPWLLSLVPWNANLGAFRYGAQRDLTSYEYAVETRPEAWRRAATWWSRELEFVFWPLDAWFGESSEEDGQGYFRGDAFFDAFEARSYGIEHAAALLILSFVVLGKLTFDVKREARRG